MRALVFGATGFIGSALVRYLRGQGYDVVGASRRSRPDGPHCSFMCITDSADVARVVNAVQPVAIFHVGGATVTKETDGFQTDVRFTQSLLDAVASARRIPKVITIGSAAEFGPLPDSICAAQEDMPCHPITEYGAAKFKQTVLAMAAASTGLPIVVARLFNVIGPGMPEHLALGRFARCIANFSRSGGVLTTGPLHMQRDFVSVADVARLLEGLAARDAALGQVVNICTGKATAIEPLVHELITISGREVTLQIDDENRGVNPVEIMIGSPARLNSLGLVAAVPNFTACLTELWQAVLAEPRSVPV
jgi:nucleoside-diphosphate-sugar epimerase